MGHTYLHAFAHPESYIHILLPPISLSSVFESCSFQSLTIQRNHWPQSMNWYIIMHVAISPFKQSAEPGTLLEVLAIGRISLHRCLSGMIQKGAVVLLLSTFEWCLHIIAELSGNQAYVMSSSFSCSQGTPHYVIEAFWGREGIVLVGVNSISICTTSSWNYASGPTWAQSSRYMTIWWGSAAVCTQIYHFLAQIIPSS